MVVLRSSNPQTAFPPGSAQRRLAGVQYQGVAVQSAVVVWSVEFVEKAGAVVSLGAFLLRKVGSPAMEVSESISIIPRAVGSRGRMGGVLVLDLNPFDGLELLGFLDSSTSFDIVDSGLTVVVG